MTPIPDDCRSYVLRMLRFPMGSRPTVGVSTGQLRSHWPGDDLSAVLRAMRDEGLIVCTDGVWSMREKRELWEGGT